MRKFLIIPVLIILILISCNNSKTKKSKKIRITGKEIQTSKPIYDPSALLITCDSINFQAIPVNGKFKLILLNGSIPFDTIKLLNLTPGFDKDIIKADLNFDSYCDIVIPDRNSVKFDRMQHHYYIFDQELGKFIENFSLPPYIGGLKLDIKNQRLKLYCPVQDCFAYYKYSADKKFEKVQGEFKP